MLDKKARSVRDIKEKTCCIFNVVLGTISKKGGVTIKRREETIIISAALARHGE